MRRKPLLDPLHVPMARSPAMKRLMRLVETLAANDITVTLIGESGTGKEVIARRLHDLSERRKWPFVPLNCAAIPEQLFESELFGHERGAFTGATERVTGKVEAAIDGTLFLDEIGEMPLSMQAKLLRFLETRKFMRVGGSTKIAVDTRVISATLRPLADEVAAGRFRPDLYYRIQGVTLEIPPLRDRRADIVPLARLFALEFSERHGLPAPRFSRKLLEMFLRHGWPGNVRELRNAVETACVLRAGLSVRVGDIPGLVATPWGAAGQSESESSEATRAGTHLQVDLDDSLAESVQRIIEAALALEGNNRSRAAERLGISLRTVQRHLSGHEGAPSPAPSRARARGRQAAQ